MAVPRVAWAPVGGGGGLSGWGGGPVESNRFIYIFKMHAWI